MKYIVRYPNSGRILKTCDTLAEAEIFLNGLGETTAYIEVVTAMETASYEVAVDGKKVDGDLDDPVNHGNPVDVLRLIADLRKNWGTKADITLHLWRDNWQA